jgi:hypothetical protein
MLVVSAEVRAEFETPVECLATDDLGVDRANELRHTVEPFRGRPAREPVEVSVGAGNVAVSACCDMDDNLSCLCHVGTCRDFRLGTYFMAGAR